MAGNRGADQLRSENSSYEASLSRAPLVNLPISSRMSPKESATIHTKPRNRLNLLWDLREYRFYLFSDRPGEFRATPYGSRQSEQRLLQVPSSTPKVLRNANTFSGLWFNNHIANVIAMLIVRCSRLPRKESYSWSPTMKSLLNHSFVSRFPDSFAFESFMSLQILRLASISHLNARFW